MTPDEIDALRALLKVRTEALDACQQRNRELEKELADTQKEWDDDTNWRSKMIVELEVKVRALEAERERLLAQTSILREHVAGVKGEREQAESALVAAQQGAERYRICRDGLADELRAAQHDIDVLKLRLGETCEYCNGAGCFGNTAHDRGIGGQTITECPRCAGSGTGELAKERSLREAAQQECAALRDANHSVAVCAEHVADIVYSEQCPCVVCALEAAQQEIERLRALLSPVTEPAASIMDAQERQWDAEDKKGAE